MAILQTLVPKYSGGQTIRSSIRRSGTSRNFVQKSISLNTLVIWLILVVNKVFWFAFFEIQDI